uniref:Odorant receptor n=1 Tax=Eucryptorrhynchus scrobiculatus TaxID=1552824 RepID=A0A8F4MY51_EUCSC|nr:odorant receptor 27 [Eucryptorrhynchus scrobiculatus]
MQSEKKAPRITALLKVIMIISGTWRLPLGTSKFTENCYFLYSILAQVSIFLLWIGTLLNGLTAIKTYDFEKVFEGIGYAIIILLLLYKIFISQTQKIKDLIVQCESEHEKTYQEEPEEVKILVEANVQVLNVILYFSFLITLFAAFVLYWTGISIYLEYRNYNSTVEKPLTIPMWCPFDHNRYYGIAFFINFYMVVIGCNYSILVQILFFTLVTHAIIQLKSLGILAKNFHRYCEIDNSQSGCVQNESVITMLRHICFKHKSIISYVDLFNTSMQNVLLLEFLLNSLNIGFLIVRLLLPNQQFRVKIFVGIYGNVEIIRLFLTAWHANEVQFQSLALSDALYASNWYEQSEKAKKIIQIIMMRSRKPLNISVGPFFAMTLDSAISTMKAAYSYVTLITTMASKK